MYRYKKDEDRRTEYCALRMSKLEKTLLEDLAEDLELSLTDVVLFSVDLIDARRKSTKVEARQAFDQTLNRYKLSMMRKMTTKRPSPATEDTSIHIKTLTATEERWGEVYDYLIDKCSDTKDEVWIDAKKIAEIVDLDIKESKHRAYIKRTIDYGISIGKVLDKKVAGVTHILVDLR